MLRIMATHVPTRDDGSGEKLPLDSVLCNISTIELLLPVSGGMKVLVRTRGGFCNLIQRLAILTEYEFEPQMNQSTYDFLFF